MFNNISRKSFISFSRIQTMEAMKIGLRIYQWSDRKNKEEILGLVKELGKHSEWCKAKLQELST